MMQSSRTTCLRAGSSTTVAKLTCGVDPSIEVMRVAGRQRNATLRMVAENPILVEKK